MFLNGRPSVRSFKTPPFARRLHWNVPEMPLPPSLPVPGLLLGPPGVGVKHVEFAHCWPALQVFPHAPQLEKLVVMSTQMSPHAVGVGG